MANGGGTLKQRTLDVGGRTLNYATGDGEGDPLVLFHGWFARWQQFLPILPFLAQAWDVYALDNRGHGRSSAAAGEYWPQDYVRDAEALIENVVREPAVLVGHSLGGWVALHLAAHHPDRVRAVVIADSPLSVEAYVKRLPEDAGAPFRPMYEIAALDADLEGVADAWGRMSAAQAGPDVSRLALHVWARSLQRIDAETLRLPADGRSREYMENIGLPGVLSNTTCPTLLIQGDPDAGGLMPDEDVRNALESLPDGYHVKLDGLDHSLGLTTWDVSGLMKALTEFLSLL